MAAKRRFIVEVDSGKAKSELSIASCMVFAIRRFFCESGPRMASPSFMMRVITTEKNAVTIAVMRPII